MSSKKIRKVQPQNQQRNYGFIFILNSNLPGPVSFITSSIQKIKNEYLPNSRFFIVSPDSGGIKDMVPEDVIVDITDPKNFEEIFAKNDFDACFTWDGCNKLTSLINFNEFFKHDIHPPEKDEYYELEWKNQRPDVSPGLMMAPDSLKFIFSQILITGRNFAFDIPYYLRALRFKKLNSIRIDSDCPFSPSVKSFNLDIQGQLKRWYNWNVRLPIRDIYESNKFYPFVAEPPVSRLIFYIIALLIFLILPVISFNAGISGDEEKHYMHAEKVYNYFATSGKDTSALYDPQLKLNYYGQSFDLLTFVVVKALKTDKIYEVRHVLNGATGALAIITAGVLARYLAGSMAGILTMIFMFFSPRFLGHSMNNPMDIPFTFGYIFTLLQMIRFLDRLPRFSYAIAALISLGIAFTISIRIGGLILIPYLFLFSGIYLLIHRWPWKLFSSGWMRFTGRGLIFLILISIAGYFISLIPWPYGLTNPIKNPFESLKMMSNIEVSLRVFFDGSIHWSDKLPWYYIPKNIFISVPVVILIGFILSAFIVIFRKKTLQRYWILVLLFATIFPVIYVIYKESNVYGGWRHLMFVFPSMVILAAISYKILYDTFNNNYIRMALGIVLFASLILPAAHIIRNYPNQYIYFNKIVGGVNKAYKNFETDYYLNSLKTGTDWIKKNVLEKKDFDPNRPLRVISNAPTLIMQYYFKDFKGIVETPYTRYYDRGIYDWDYAVFFCNYIDPNQIRRGIWPPKNTVFTVDVDDVAVGAVVKRENREDFEGSSMLSRGLGERDIKLISEGIYLLEKAVEYDPANEAAWINLATGYIMIQEFEMARQRLSRLLEVYPKYDRALSTIGYSYLNEGETFRDMMKIDKGISYLNEALKVNYKHSSSYYYLGMAYYLKKDYQNALKNLQSSIDYSPGYRDPYVLVVQILEETGRHQEAASWREYLQNL